MDRFKRGGYRSVKNAILQKKRILTVFFLTLFFVFSLIMTSSGVLSARTRRKNTAQYIASEEIKIQNAVLTRITTTKALKMYVVSQDGRVSNFQEFASYLYDDDPALISIQLAPNGVVTRDFTYPYQEDFVSHDLFADPDRKADAEHARDNDEIILSGPLDLRQGGQGMIVRNPIYLTSEKGEKVFWGFGIVVFDVSKIFDAANLNLLTNKSYNYRLWRYVPTTNEVQVIAENTDQEIRRPLHKKISVYHDDWYLDIEPQNHWVSVTMMGFELVFFAVITVLAVFALSSHLKAREILYIDSLLQIGNSNALNYFYGNLPKNMWENLYVVVFDVDKFKEYNYIYGSEEGDRLLRYIADTLQEESPSVKLFRYYSDYFVALNTCGDQETYIRQIEGVFQRFDRDIKAGVIPPFDISAGIRKTKVGEPLSVAVSDALIARDTVKGNALKHYAIYDAEIRKKRLAYMEIESNFPAALQNKEFKVYYQPKYNMITGELIGAEALARWVRPDGTMISPGDFIPCLEESRQIVLLDEEMFSEVCRQMKEMEEDGIAVKHVSVNLSRAHLTVPGILPKIQAIFERFGVDPANFSFEITESVLYEDKIPLREIMEGLHALGCKVDMDDYGVGVSGPNSLISNSFDMVKLDKSFVDNLDNERVEDVIRSTVYMARKWGMAVLAEGVESYNQAKKLVSLGCVQAQGFFYSRPIPEEEYRKLLQSPMVRLRSERKVPVTARFFTDDIRAVMDSYIFPTYIINPDTFVVLYTNRAMQEYIGEDGTGGKCYQKMRGKDTPCADCTAMRLYRNHDNSPKEFVTPRGGSLPSSRVVSALAEQGLYTDYVCGSVYEYIKKIECGRFEGKCPPDLDGNSGVRLYATIFFDCSREIVYYKCTLNGDGVIIGPSCVNK